MLIRLWLVALLSFGISSLCASDSALPVFHFGHISAQDGLPTDEVRQIYQDKDGYIWIATNSGLCQYDGYQIKTYKSNLHTPGLLSNNTICCVAEDNHHNLWIAAYDGVNVLNKTTGHIRKIDSKELRRSIVDRLLVTATDRIFIGTEAGVFEYFPEKDSCVAFKPDVLKGSVTTALIISICQAFCNKNGMIRQFFVTNVKAGRCTPGLVCSRTALGQFSARLRRLSGEARR